MLQQNKNRDSYLKGLLEEQQSVDTTGEKHAKECLICQETIEKGMITYW
jgi:tRNA U54 and U55 pseudouridine synthase Pus10